VWALVTGTLGATASPAADHFLLVGGGPLPGASQVSIERNVIWIEELMRDRAFASQRVLFASGPSGPPDVSVRASDDPEVVRWLPLARLFGEHARSLLVFRRNQVPGVAAPASAKAVTEALRQSLAGLGPGDSLLFSFNGHGSWRSPDTSQNAMRLWGESRLDVRRFREVLDARPAGVTVRYLLPQCFSGGFARSLAKDVSRPDVSEIVADQCGFFSVADDAPAEGCTASVDVGEYRDYATAFFSAIAGRTRLGAPLARDPDRDGDGRVSLGEAHAYAYTEGLSTDVPRATSEHYLEHWSPWYARWQSTRPPEPDDPHLRMALRLAENLGLDDRRPSALAAEAVSRRRMLEKMAEAETRHLAGLAKEETALRKRLLNDLDREWPAAGHPHSHAYAELVATRTDALLAWIREHPGFTKLAGLQSLVEQVEWKRLELRRRAAAHARVQRAVMLAATRANFDRLASPAEREAYASLLACEAWSPPVARSAQP
jgi:hypothetical protein